MSVLTSIMKLCKSFFIPVIEPMTNKKNLNSVSQASALVAVAFVKLAVWKTVHYTASKIVSLKNRKRVQIALR